MIAPATVLASLLAMPVLALQAVPPAPLPARESPVSAPAPGSAEVALAPRTETVVLSAPVPTVSPTWGYRSAVIDGRIVGCGPERSMAPGACGQICLWTRDGGTWKADPDLAQVERVGAGAFVLSRLERGGPFVFTLVDRRGEGSSIRVLEPQGNRVTEVASVILPPGADLPSFGSSFASDGATLVVGSADMRFTRGADAPERTRDPRAFVFTRRGSLWTLDGFVRTPPSADGTPTDAMWFGASLDVDGDVLAVGSPGTMLPRPNEVFPFSGTPRVQVYRRMSGQWMAETTIEGYSLAPLGCFGLTVAVEGDLLAVRGLDPGSPESAARVWLFARTGGKWALAQELVPAKGIAQGRGYGVAMAISKGRVLVGDGTARGADERGATPGMVLVFERRGDAWENTMRLMPHAPCAPRSFGNDIGAEWPLVTVGRPKSESMGLEPGGVYVFELGDSATPAQPGQAVSPPRPQ